MNAPAGLRRGRSSFAPVAVPVAASLAVRVARLLAGLFGGDSDPTRVVDSVGRALLQHRRDPAEGPRPPRPQQPACSRTAAWRGTSPTPGSVNFAASSRTRLAWYGTELIMMTTTIKDQAGLDSVVPKALRDASRFPQDHRGQEGRRGRRPGIAGRGGSCGERPRLLGHRRRRRTRLGLHGGWSHRSSITGTTGVSCSVWWWRRMSSTAARSSSSSSGGFAIRSAMAC